MPIYTGPEVFKEGSNNKFVRVRENIYIPTPTADIFHDELAKHEGVFEEMLRLRQEEIDAVDAGMFRHSDGKLFIFNYSTSLMLPLSQKARELTLELARLQTPGYSVVDHGMYSYYLKKNYKR